MSTTTMALNWAGNHAYPGTLVRPTTLAEAADVVARSPRVRAIGSRHSFNDLVDSATLVSLDALAYRHPGMHRSDAPGALGDGTGTADSTGSTSTPGDVSTDGTPTTETTEPELDPATGRVRVPAATRYADLVRFLEDRGRTLPNLASLPHIGLAGTLATATHGSGIRNPVLGAAATRLELIAGDGSPHAIDREADPEVFDGAVVSLGALGVVTAVTLQSVPAFDVAQTAYGPVPFDDVVDGFAEVSALAYSVSCFTTFRTRDFTVWLKQAADRGVPVSAPERVLGAPALETKVHPLPGVDPENCTDQLGLPGPAGDRLPHFRADHLPSAGAEIQSEYLIPRANARAALRALDRLAPALVDVVQVCEVRTVAADRFWLSPMFARDCLGIHFTFVRDAAAVDAVLPLLEDAFGPLDGVPHWGKVFRADPVRLRARYPRRADFVDLARSYDPDGKFTNDFLRRWVL
ncbi:FAD-binding protein [Georgenia sp. TF02-10]|uniref:D-arabinono-1,4-lactone oxidase n=1 Tax=Georgenia sp. TF02-10 TaxID=2917725 RepID=UPI001FA6E1C2|nr:D-arabinono-1,4-lactone oxidase [Georgenia sp. TF02-10]UNX53950.1 FAD-binding protein [Georgenia sp. TF02-10]